MLSSLLASISRLSDLGMLGEVIGPIRRHPREESRLHSWTIGESKVHVCRIFGLVVLIHSHGRVNSFLNNKERANALDISQLYYQIHLQFPAFARSIKRCFSSS